MKWETVQFTYFSEPLWFYEEKKMLALIEHKLPILITEHTK